MHERILRLPGLPEQRDNVPSDDELLEAAVDVGHRLLQAGNALLHLAELQRERLLRGTTR